MNSYIDVSFQRIDRDPSIESAIHRSVARFAAMGFGVQRAAATVELGGHNRMSVRLTLVLADGTSRTATAAHTDPYIAVSDAFRVVQQLVAASPDRVRVASGQLVA